MNMRTIRASNIKQSESECGMQSELDVFAAAAAASGGGVGTWYDLQAANG